MHSPNILPLIFYGISIIPKKLVGKSLLLYWSIGDNDGSHLLIPSAFSYSKIIFINILSLHWVHDLKSSPYIHYPGGQFDAQGMQKDD